METAIAFENLNIGKTMRKFALISFIALTTMVTPALAEGLDVNDQLGTSLEEVTNSLTDRGYEVRKAEMEDGKIEVYFVKDGTLGEVYVSPQTGQIIKLEMK